MEADSLAQSVEMSAVPWPPLQLCFSVISNREEIELLLFETARKGIRNVTTWSQILTDPHAVCFIFI